MKTNRWLEFILEALAKFLLGVFLVQPAFIILDLGFVGAEWVGMVAAFSAGAFYCWILFWLED